MVRRGNVLFNFEASKSEYDASDDVAEVDLHVGEVVEILEMYDDGWWLIRTIGPTKSSTGLAPSNYIELIHSGKVKGISEMETNSSPKLPFGWDYAIDKESNEPYYYNKDNGININMRVTECSKMSFIHRRSSMGNSSECFKVHIKRKAAYVERNVEFQR